MNARCSPWPMADSATSDLAVSATIWSRARAFRRAKYQRQVVTHVAQPKPHRRHRSCASCRRRVDLEEAQSWDPADE